MNTNIRPGDPIRTLPCSGDELRGRCTAVFVTEHSPPRRYYRVRFALPSPYFAGTDPGVIYREHEIAPLTAEVPAAPLKSRLPPRPKPTNTSTS
jgi:hypothetical protein